MDFSNSRINNNNNLNINQVSFTGQKPMKDIHGNKISRLFPPYIKIDKDKEELGIEIVRMTNTTNKGNKQDYDWTITSEKPIRVAVDREFAMGKKTYFDLNLQDRKYRVPEAEIGYRYVVYKKDDSKTLDQKEYATTYKGEPRTYIYTDSVATTVSSDKLGNFTVLSQRQGTPRNQGPMEDIFADSWNVIHRRAKETTGKEGNLQPEDFDEVNRIRRTHFNIFGGGISGVTEKLDTELKGNKLIKTNPASGGGVISSHKYHPNNIFRISEGMGDKKDFNDLLVKCFETGQGYVLDGAFTSQGYEGIQLNHALKWKDSVFKYWFKNPSESGFELGVLPDSDNKYTGIRVVNPKGVDGYKYDPNMPSYIQFYDTRLVSQQQLNEKGTLIREYDNLNTEDPYETCIHQDGTLNNFFEIDPSSKTFYGKDYISLEGWRENGDLDELLNPVNMPYRFTTKDETGGLTGWDGNIDLVKMNLSNHSADPRLQEGMAQTRNHMCNNARYWTEDARNTLLHHIAGNLRDANAQNDNDASVNNYLNGIEKTYKKIDRGSLVQIHENIQREQADEDKGSVTGQKSYKYVIGDDKRDANTFLLDKMLEFPLDSLDFSPELLGVLSTPMITPRPGKDMHPLSDKTEILEYALSDKATTKLAPSMKKVYTETLPKMLRTVMYDVGKRGIDDSNKRQERRRLFEANGNEIDKITPYGKYFLEMASNEIMTFLITEGLFGDCKEILGDEAVEKWPIYRTDEDGVKTMLDFGYADKLKGTKGYGRQMTLNRLGVNATSQESEAEEVAKRLNKGLETLKEKKPKQYNEFIDYLITKYMSIDLEDYKMAEAIVDQTGTGLNWRFDAAKDVADWDEVKEGLITSEEAWDDVNDVWQPFVGEIRKYNPPAYVIAEVTSLGDFDKFNWGKYEGDNEDGRWMSQKPENVYYEITGATTGSNYSTFFGLYPKFFGQNTEEGSVDGGLFHSIEGFLNKVNQFLQPTGNGRNSAEFIIGSHVFTDNHDKPRTAHLMAIDADLYWNDFKKGGKLQPDLMARAEKVLNRPFADNMSSKAVAVAEKYYEYFDKEAKALGIDENSINIIKDSITMLANGYPWKSTDEVTISKKPSYRRAEGFASTPYEISVYHVLDQAKFFGAKFDDDQARKLADMVRADMVRPYISKMTAIYEMMNGVVGIPTLYAGDEFAQTGGERKSKNWDLGCRNMIRHDWIDENPKEDVIKFNKRLRATAMLNEQEGMDPLSGGTPIVCPPPKSVIVKTGDDLTNGLEFIGNNNAKDLVATCTFTNAVQSKLKGEDGKIDLTKFDKLPDADKGKLKDDVVAELKAMDKNTLQTKYEKRLPEVEKENSGLYGWLLTNTATSASRVGAVYKYNDQGEGVVTAITTAYIPDNPGPNELKTNVENPPTVSELVLKDNQGNLIAEPGTIFVMKKYDEKQGKYVDDTENGNYKYTEEGKLENTNGNEAVTLDSTVTYFRKQPDAVSDYPEDNY